MTTREKIVEFAKKIGRVTVLKKILRRPYEAYLQRESKKMLRVFKKHGFVALKRFDECLNSHNINYSLAFGTLLGAVREHDFIPFDNDIDLAMWIDDYKPEMIDYLKEYGIKLKHTFSVDNDTFGKEDSFEYKGVQLDIFYFYRDNEGKTYCCDFVNQPDCDTRIESIKKHGGLLPRRLFLPLSDQVIRTDFKGIEVSIPANYQDILEFRYGKDYMTPKPGWRPDTKYIIPVLDKLGIYKDFE